MARLLLAFLFGVLSTIAVFYVIDDQTIETHESTVSQSEPANDLMEAPGSDNETEVVTATDVGDEQSLPPMPTESAAYSGQSRSAIEVDGALQSGNGAHTPPSATPSRTASRDYPPEIADMIEKRVDKGLQAQYESDEREESWATFMEGQLKAYFGQKPELAQFNFSLIDCRTSICEVHALGYGPNALTSWTTGTADLVAQTWHDFKSMSVNQYNPQPDILGIVLILSRKE
jgi:hypothetical protein